MPNTNSGSSKFQSDLVGPKGWPILGNALEFGASPLDFFQNSARKYGDIVPMRFGAWPAVLVSHLPSIEKILVKEHENFVKQSLVYRQFDALFGKGLLTNEGPSWRIQRRIAAKAFAGNRLDGYGPVAADYTKQMLSKWKADTPFDIHEQFMQLALKVVVKALFDDEVDADTEIIDHALEDLVVEVTSRIKRPFLIPDAVPLPGHLRYRKAIRDLDNIVGRMIAERRLEGADGRKDLLSSFMTERDEDGNFMSETLLRDEAITMLLAGHETTALTLSWTAFLVGQDTDLQQRMRAEINEVVGDRDILPADLEKLPLLECVVLESMRLYPPAWAIGREAVSDFELDGHQFPAGTAVTISQWVLHRDPRYFEDPETFKPERWSDGLLRKLPRFAYMPFGGGPRVCIGQRFAMMETKLMLATILKDYTLFWTGGQAPEPIPSITLRPLGGVTVTAQKT